MLERYAAAWAASPEFTLRWRAERSALKRNVNAEEVAHAAAFLASDLASGVTGQVLYVDAGHNIFG